jgi:hypothetical protein
VACRHHYHRHQSCSRRGGAGKRILYILAVGVVVAAAVSMFRGRSDRDVSPPPAPARLSGMPASKLQTYASESGIAGGAAAAEKALAALPPPDEIGDPTRTVPVNVPVNVPVPPQADAARPIVDVSPGKPKPAIKIRVRSDKPYPNKDLALSDALVKAGVEIHAALREQDPPIEVRPGWEKVKTHYLRPETVRFIEATPEQKQAWAEQSGGRIDDTNRYWAQLEVEVSDEQVRDLRSEQRVGATGVVAAVGFVLVLALFGFLRLDAWTKGYLTGGLAVAVVAAAGAVVALLVLA